MNSRIQCLSTQFIVIFEQYPSFMDASLKQNENELNLSEIWIRIEAITFEHSFLAKCMLEYKEPWHEYEAGVMCSLSTLTWVFKRAFQTFSMTRILFCSALPTPSTHDPPLKPFTVNAPVIAVSHRRITSHRPYWRYSTCWSFSRPLQNTASYLTQTQLWEQKEPSQQVDRLHMKQAQGGFTPLRATLEHLEWNQYAFFECRWGWERIQQCSSSKGKIVCVKLLLMLVTRKWVFPYLSLWDVLASASDLVYA